MSQQKVVTSQQEAASLEQPLRSLLVGRPLKRMEDPRLLTGSSLYVDDMKLPSMLHAAVLRSPYAHAKIKNVNIEEAVSASGVRLVMTAGNLPKDLELPTDESDDGTKLTRPVLASTEVCYAGEPIAFVVANTRYEAEDALELIQVSYEELPSIIDPAAANKEDAPRAHESLKSNVVRVETVTSGDVEECFGKASKVVRLDLLNQRLAPSPLETRAILASYNSGADLLNIWFSTQGPFQSRSMIAEALGIQENRLRVIAPEVGGGFGAKMSLYSEDLLTCLATMKLGLPVKWTETRSENLQNMTHGRGQIQHVEIASNEKGRILGLKVSLIGDSGAYLTEGSADASFTLKMAPGPYMIPAYCGEARIVLTNKVPHDSYRGASRPEATYLLERAMDELARELGLDPVEVRLRNFIPREEFPFTSAGDLTYDSGDYAMNLRKSLELSNYDKWREEQRRARAQGRLVGIGLSTYVEVCAFGPELPQTASISVTDSGKVTVTTGNSPHGQGHETPLAQIVADKLGLKVEEIYVTYGDTAQLPWGTLTAGSRSGPLGGTAVLMCAEKIRDKMARIAAKSLGVPPEEIGFEDGHIFSLSQRNDPKKKLEFHKVASLAYKPKELPEGMEPVLFAFSAFAPTNYTFPFGTHIAVVEVDRDTGKIKILEYTSVDDCGKVLNPLVVEGQIHGGITQGLGQALLEDVKYDENGQLLSASFLDYQIPIAEDIPDYHSFRTETPTYANPLGIKGIGEAGTVAATPALANAVADALAPLDIKVLDMPLSPPYLKKLLAKA